MDRDYLDDRRFPPEEGAGVLVIHAPDERQLFALVARVSRIVFGGGTAAAAGSGPSNHAEEAVSSDSGSVDTASAQARTPLPLEGRKLHVHTDWGRDDR
jgi:hypothetical protein